MSSNLKALSVASLVFAFLPGVVAAEFTNVALPEAAPEREVVKSCTEALREAQFVRELMKTDGDTNPDLPALAPCGDEAKAA